VAIRLSEEGADAEQLVLRDLQNARQEFTALNVRGCTL
jgi:hypothetical protein